MHKILFISYHFPPCHDIGGSLRSEKFAKYLPRLGWLPCILALSQHDPEVEEMYPGVERVPSLTPWSQPYQITPYGWLLPLYLHGRRLLRSNEYDLIYVSCPPFPQTIVASLLKRFTGIPLVIDFRDAWSLEPYTGSSYPNILISKTLSPTMEKYALTDVDKLIVNTPSSLEAYLAKYPELAGHITIIPNGYDEEDFVDYRPGKQNRQMTFLYTGRFGISGRNPMPLLKAFRQLVEEHLPVHLHIIGDQGPILPHLLADLGLGSHVRLFGQTPHKEAIHAMAHCDALVLYQERSKKRITSVAGKTYEYLRAGKAILAIAPPGDNLNIIREYAARYETVSTHDAYDIAKAIRALYRDWEKGALTPYMPPKKDYLYQYNHQVLAARLASLFDGLVAMV